MSELLVVLLAIHLRRVEVPVAHLAHVLHQSAGRLICHGLAAEGRDAHAAEAEFVARRVNEGHDETGERARHELLEPKWRQYWCKFVHSAEFLEWKLVLSSLPGDKFWCYEYFFCVYICDVYKR